VASLEATANYKLYDDKMSVKSEGEAKTSLDENYLTLTLTFGEPMLFAYTDITGILDRDYTIEITFTSNEKLILNSLGYQYEDFLFQLYKLRNELMLRYLLMQESLIQAGFEGQYAITNAEGQNKTGHCEIRLYEVALVILPQKADPIRIPYCYISQMSKGDYKLALTDEFQQKIELSQLGSNFDPLAKALSDAFNRMITRTQETIKELIPETDPATLRKLASLMKDGRAAKRKDVGQLSSDFWRRLIKQIDEANLKAEYDFLESQALKDQICVGVKRGLMGNLTGSYTWLLFPISNSQSGKLTNAVALEAFNRNEQQANHENQEQTDTPEDTASNEEGDQQSQSMVPEGTFDKEEDDQQNESKEPTTTGATYFFRLMGKNEFAQAKAEEITKQLDNFILNTNRAMIDINFRREPIYLSDYQLDSPKYTQYRFAIQNIPSLRLLRNLFIGRVIHSALEQWKTDISSLLTFNTKSLDDKEKWRKEEP
jgi:hypothetical protein